MSLEEKKFPSGIILILIYIGINLFAGFFNILNSLFGLTGLAVQFGPFLVSGFGAYFYHIFSLLVSGLLFYGLIKRKIWSRYLGIFLFIFYSLFVIFNFVFLLFNPSMYDSLYRELLSDDLTLFPFLSKFSIVFVGFSVFFYLIICFLIVFYLYRNSNYFEK